MSRSGYIDDMDDQWRHIMWRGAVASAIKGARGQAFLKEMIKALDIIADRKLIAKELATMDGAVCALGAVGQARGIDMHEIDPEDSATVSNTFGIAEALAREIVFMNDDGGLYGETPEQRFARMREWVQGEIRKDSTNE